MKIKFLISMLTFVILFTNAYAQTYSSSNMNLIGHIKPGNSKFAGCWGWYQESENREYALVQAKSGMLYFIDITIPNAPVVRDSVKGGYDRSREVNTYQNFCYSICGGPNTDTFQIIDMQYLPDSVHVVYNGSSYFNSAHALTIDNDKMYLTYVKHGNNYHSIDVYSLATPSAPVLVGNLDDDFKYPNAYEVHDMFVKNDTVYASATYKGLAIFKFDGAHFNYLGSLTNYPQSGYNHSSSLTQDRKTLVFCDEVPSGLAIKIADVSNFSNIQITALCLPYNDSNFIAHNPYVVGNKWAYISCYQDGLLVYDISNPHAPVLAGYFDTYPQGGNNINNYGTYPYEGNWGAYPYFPSGHILALDVTNGAFILKPSATIGVKENFLKALEVEVYPNPASQQINYNISKEMGDHTVELVDVFGKLVYKEEYKNKQLSGSVDVSNYPNSVYILNIYTKDSFFKEKVIVSHN